MDNQLTFKKSERISRKSEIDILFDRGNAFISYPLRVVYVEQKPLSGAAIAVLVSVPKKKIKHAVQRNRIKRLIREAYRLNKAALIQHCTEKECGLLIAFLYTGNESCRWTEIDATMQKALNSLKEIRE